MTGVTSFTLVWIKITPPSSQFHALNVTSFTLVWIKITLPAIQKTHFFSHELHARVD